MSHNHPPPSPFRPGNASANPATAPEFAYAFAVPALCWVYLRSSLRLYTATVLGAFLLLRRPARETGGAR